MPSASQARPRQAGGRETPSAPTAGAPFARRAGAALAAWLVPGAGHWLLGSRVRAVVIGAGLLGLFWFGQTALAGNIAVSSEVSPIFYACQIGNGASTLAADRIWGSPQYDIRADAPDRDMPPHYHLGILFTTVSGLLNVLAVVHVLDPRTWQAAREARTTGASGVGAKDSSPPGGPTS